jgi:G3E family GTPase
MASLFPELKAGDRLNVSLVTGFLGSGKTTLLNRLLRSEEMAKTAIVINEFGDVALDQHFLERSDGEVVVMANGCICCSMQGELEGIVGTLFAKREASEVPAFDRLVIETTGLADPAPIMQMLLDNPLLGEAVRLDAVIATVDAVNGSRQLREHAEAVKQAALADRIVITKTDLAAAPEVAALTRRLAELNPAATRFDLAAGEVAPAQLFDAALMRRDGRLREVSAWLGADEHEDGAHEHLHDIITFTLVLPAPLEWRSFSRWLRRLRIRHADQLLRVKGILTLLGEDQPVAIHGVHHVFHPPMRLPRREDDADSRLVFITSGLTRAEVEADWRDFQDGSE